MNQLESELTPVSHARVVIDDQFWSPRIQANREGTIPQQYHQCEETGRLDAFRLDWRPGQEPKPHFFWDSDVAKWIEAASYSLATHPDPALDALLDEVIALIVSAQQADGYLNSYFTAVEPDKRWTNLRDNHELYCAGHLIEAAVAHFQVTGKRTLLDALCRYTDYIAAVFGREPGRKRGYDGHEEIELALVKLSQATGEQKYLELARYFVEERGQQPHFFDEEARERGEEPQRFGHGTYEYCQAHAPVREQSEVVGHAVRAMYLYCAMADLARERGDESLQAACERLWRHLCGKRMYITGGIGPSARNEGFTRDYDLPNESAYAETCAAIGLVLWGHRMLHLDCDGHYADVMERALYNGMLAGLSLDGRKYFYVNPLESRGAHHRQEWFGCACCPPNLARLLASLGGYIYSQGENEIAVHLYVAGSTRLQINGQAVALRQQTDYPWSGSIRIVVEPESASTLRLKLRLPGWCREAQLEVNSETMPVQTDKGYFAIEREWRAGDQIVLELAMPIERMYAHPLVKADAGRVALMRGPLVYCLEETDDGPNINALSLPRGAKLEAKFEEDLLGGVVTISGSVLRAAEGDWGSTLYRSEPPATESATFKAVPYYAWDNRAPGEMLVWLREH